MSIAPIRQLKHRHGGYEPFEQEFTFNPSAWNTIHTVTIPANGLYKLEVWGAKGVDLGRVSGYGGYSQGHVFLRKNTTLYVAVGGSGYEFNGGNTSNSHSTGWGILASGGGGGATHIAKVTGELNDIGYESFVTNGNGLIVAGGGGGSGYYDEYNVGYHSNTGNNAGGLTGGVGSTGRQAAGQTSGYAFGLGEPTIHNSSGYGGGGGGLYGGYNGTNDDGDGKGGCGGSSYIGGVPEITYKGVTYTPSTTGGANNGEGKAKITRIA